MGADGHIYRGRVERLEAKLPPRMAYSAAMQQKQMNSEVIHIHLSRRKSVQSTAYFHSMHLRTKP